MDDIVLSSKIFPKSPKYRKLPLSPHKKEVKDSLVENTPKSNLVKKDSEDDFEKNVKKFFEEKRFVISDIYSHENMKDFLKDKDVAMGKLDLNDSLDEEEPKKKNKNKNTLSPRKRKRISRIQKSGSINSHLFSKESNEFKDLISEFL